MTVAFDVVETCKACLVETSRGGCVGYAARSLIWSVYPAPDLFVFAGAAVVHVNGTTRPDRGHFQPIGTVKMWA